MFIYEHKILEYSIPDQILILFHLMERNWMLTYRQESKLDDMLFHCRSWSITQNIVRWREQDCWNKSIKMNIYVPIKWTERASHVNAQFISVPSMECWNIDIIVLFGHLIKIVQSFVHKLPFSEKPILIMCRLKNIANDKRQVDNSVMVWQMEFHFY